MAKSSAGILLYRVITDEPEVLLVHPGRAVLAEQG